MSADFLDTNVFVYLLDRGDSGHRDRATEIVTAGRRRGAVISHQVVQETLNVITRKIPFPLNASDARQFMNSVLVGFWKVQPTNLLFSRALDVQARYHFAFYDSLIVAAALEAGCDRLLTEDLQHGQVIEGLTVENPFRGL